MALKIILCAAAAVIAVSAAVLAVKVKKLIDNGICPLCYAKKFTKKSKLTVDADGNDYPAGECLQPPMGWASWNLFHNKVDENLILETAKAMKDSGLADAGYEFVNIDDCWQSSARDENGDLQSDFSTFPSGISSLCTRIEQLGLKLGIYSSNGTHTCEDLPASLGNEQRDADTFARWGIRYLKYDFCNNKEITGEAPKIIALSVSEAGKSGQITLPVKDAQLYGRAKLRSFNGRNLTETIISGLNKEEDMDGEYIAFLGYGAGKAVFNAQVPADGEYVLTLTLKKDGKKEKYLQAQIGEELYELFIPGLNPWTLTARFQFKAALKAGKNQITFQNPIVTKSDSTYTQYKRMGYALQKAAIKHADNSGANVKPITYSICEWGVTKPWLWGSKAGNLWRTTRDILPIWQSILKIYDKTIRLYRYSSPGHINDPDMLEVGNGKLTYKENESHFALWCMMGAPLILGNDVRPLAAGENPQILKLLTNRQLICIDKDALGKTAKRVKHGAYDVIARPLADGSTAVCMLNRGKKRLTAYIDINTLINDEYIKTSVGDNCKIHNIVGNSVLKGGTVSAVLGTHACAVFKLSG